MLHIILVMVHVCGGHFPAAPQWQNPHGEQMVYHQHHRHKQSALPGGAPLKAEKPAAKHQQEHQGQRQQDQRKQLLADGPQNHVHKAKALTGIAHGGGGVKLVEHPIINQLGGIEQKYHPGVHNDQYPVHLRPEGSGQDKHQQGRGYRKQQPQPKPRLPELAGNGVGPHQNLRKLQGQPQVHQQPQPVPANPAKPVVLPFCRGLPPALPPAAVAAGRAAGRSGRRLGRPGSGPCRTGAFCICANGAALPLHGRQMPGIQQAVYAPGIRLGAGGGLPGCGPDSSPVHGLIQDALPLLLCRVIIGLGCGAFFILIIHRHPSCWRLAPAQNYCYLL